MTFVTGITAEWSVASGQCMEFKLSLLSRLTYETT